VNKAEIRQQILNEIISAWEENGNFSKVIPALLVVKLGVDAETVDKHCAALEAEGLIQRYEGGWKITAAGMKRGRENG
jgi:Mn-dependent DtxR family transcriptional regulator